MRDEVDDTRVFIWFNTSRLNGRSRRAVSVATYREDEFGNPIYGYGLFDEETKKPLPFNMTPARQRMIELAISLRLG